MLYDTIIKQPLSIRYQGTYKHFCFFNKSYFLDYTVFLKTDCYVIGNRFLIKNFTVSIFSSKKEFIFILINYHSFFLLHYSLYKFFLKNLVLKLYNYKFCFDCSGVSSVYNHNLYTFYCFNINFKKNFIFFIKKYIFHIYSFYFYFFKKNLHTYNNIYNLYNILLQTNKNLHLFYLNFFKKIKNFFCKSFRIYLKHKWNPRWYVRKRKVILSQNLLVIPKKFIKKDKKVNVKAVYKHYIDESTDTANEFQRLTFLKNFFKFYSLQRFRKPLKLSTYVTLVKSYGNIEVNNFKQPLLTFSVILPKSITASKHPYYHILIDSLLVLNNRFYKKYKWKRFFKLTKKRRNISIRKTFRTHTKPLRIIGKFFRRVYDRSFHNFNFKKIFKNIFLFNSTRISFHDIFWLNPVYNIKRSKKRINKLKNIYSIRHKSRFYNINKYNNFFPLFAVKRKYFFKILQPRY